MAGCLVAATLGEDAANIAREAEGTGFSFPTFTFDVPERQEPDWFEKRRALFMIEQLQIDGRHGVDNESLGPKMELQRHHPTSAAVEKTQQCGLLSPNRISWAFVGAKGISRQQSDF